MRFDGKPWTETYEGQRAQISSSLGDETGLRARAGPCKGRRDFNKEKAALIWGSLSLGTKAGGGKKDSKD